MKYLHNYKTEGEFMEEYYSQQKEDVTLPDSYFECSLGKFVFAEIGWERESDGYRLEAPPVPKVGVSSKMPETQEEFDNFLGAMDFNGGEEPVFIEITSVNIKVIEPPYREPWVSYHKNADSKYITVEGHNFALVGYRDCLGYHSGIN